MKCLSCILYDKNDPLHCYGTCEPQDMDYHATHECNLPDREKDFWIKRRMKSQFNRRLQ